MDNEKGCYYLNDEVHQHVLHYLTKIQEKGLMKDSDS